MQGVSVLCQAGPHTGINGAHDPALMVVCHVGAGHPGYVPQGRRRILVSVRHRRQIYKVTGRNHCGQDQQAIYSQVYQVNSLQVWGPK
jgi:hypothetical protein